MKKQVIVINGNMLGILRPGQAPAFATAEILATAVSAMRSPWDGLYQLGNSPTRPATLKDFETYRVRASGYQNDPTFEPIAA
jgi:hypothetical protein